MILLKKAIRSMWRQKGAYIACVVLILVGINMYTMYGILVESLTSAVDNYYQEQNLADVFATVNSIPKADVSYLKNINGVQNAEGRYVYDARVNMPDADKIITLRLISYDPNNIENSGIDVPYIVDGTSFKTDNDIMVSSDYMKAYNLSVGDSISVIIKGKSYDFNICAAVDSPEYVFAIKDVKQQMPDASVFQVAYVPENTLLTALGNSGTYNDVTFTLENGYTYDDVKSDIQQALDQYGLISLTQQKDQLSYSMLNGEITGITTMSSIIPFIFVFMSMVILYLMLKRVIEQERTQIGTLKAFGYTRTEVMFHYMLYGLITGIVGGLAGTMLGSFLAGPMLLTYSMYFTIPGLAPVSATSYIISGMIIAIVGSCIGALMGTWGCLKLSPADAMHAETPKEVKVDIVKYLGIIRHALTSRGLMAVRSISRSKVRSLFVIVGIGYSFAMLTMTGTFAGMMSSMATDQFEKIQVYDAEASLNVPNDYNTAVQEIYGVNGVTKAEGILEVPVSMSYKSKDTGTMITGLNEDASLLNIYDSGLKRSFLPPTDGIIISNGIADSLGIEAGDNVEITSPYLRNDADSEMDGNQIFLRVDRVVEQDNGTSSYMERGALEQAFGISGDICTSVIFDTTDMAAAKDYLLNADNVAAVDDINSTRVQFQQMMGVFIVMFDLMFVMAIAITFAIIYNTTTISLSERKREYATLRVLGMSVKEVAQIMGFEYWLLGFLGMIVGIPLGIAFMDFMGNIFNSTMDSMTLVIHVPLSAFVIAFLGCSIAIYLSNRVAVHAIKKFDMVEVLKERE